AQSALKPIPIAYEVSQAAALNSLNSPLMSEGYQTDSAARKLRKPFFAAGFASSATSGNVSGAGAVGTLAVWTGSTSAGSFLGQANIYQNKQGLVGIGTTSPAAMLTVAGTIQSTSGGIKFPDGTVQATAALIPPTPVLQPFQTSQTFSYFTTDLSVPHLFTTVPAGKRLVIDYASARMIFATGNSIVSLQITTVVDGVPVDCQLLPVFVSQARVGPDTLSYFIAAQQVRLYADPGSQIMIQSQQLGNTGITGGTDSTLTISISGHPVDAQ
ncbi:MAG: hypothetical protein ACREAC_26420, partial [Blastocatellia bacterium]